MLDRSVRGLILVLSALLSAPAMAQEADVLSLRAAHPALFGVSAVSVSADGSDITLITDRGSFAEARLQRRDGRPVSLKISRIGSLRDGRGQPLSGRHADAEGIALGTNGAVLVSFENDSRIVLYPRLDAAAQRIPVTREFSSFPINKGIEALASDATTLLAIPEIALRDGSFPVYRFRGDRWDVAFRIAGAGGFRPTGADLGPDGRLYVLERRLAAPVGFASRIRRFAPDGGDETVILETPVGQFGNLEGISVWREPTGRLRALMVSDDNGLPIQRGDLVEISLPD